MKKSRERLGAEFSQRAVDCRVKMTATSRLRGDVVSTPRDRIPFFVGCMRRDSKGQDVNGEAALQIDSPFRSLGTTLGKLLHASKGFVADMVFDPFRVQHGIGRTDA